MAQNYRRDRQDNWSRQEERAFQKPTDQDLQAILIQGDASSLVTWGENIGKFLAQSDRLTTNQLRNIFGTVRQIQMRWTKGNEVNAWNEIVLLRPKMAYFAKRAAEGKGENKSDGIEHLRDVIEPAILLLDKNRPKPPTDQQFRRFVDFFEAIVAYHTRYATK